jgi:hypothetical protein
VTDELRQLDEGIVKNSVRFRWQEIRRELRETLDAERVLTEGSSQARAPVPGDTA